MPGFFDRQALVSGWKQREIGEAKPLVIGAGALGNEVVKNLVQLGVRRISLVDFDTIEDANLNRCVFFGKEDVGEKKAYVLARKASALLDSTVVPTDSRVEQLDDVFFDGFTHAILCLDNLGARLHANSRAYQAGLTIIDGGTTGFFGKVQVTRKPGACLECIVGSQDYKAMWKRYSCKGQALDFLDPKMPALATTTSVIAALQANEFIKSIHRIPTLEGKYAFFNGLNGELRVFEAAKRANCPVHV